MNGHGALTFDTASTESTPHHRNLGGGSTLRRETPEPPAIALLAIALGVAGIVSAKPMTHRASSSSASCSSSARSRWASGLPSAAGGTSLSPARPRGRE